MPLASVQVAGVLHLGAWSEAFALHKGLRAKRLSTYAQRLRVIPSLIPQVMRLLGCCMPTLHLVIHCLRRGHGTMPLCRCFQFGYILPRLLEEEEGSRHSEKTPWASGAAAGREMWRVKLLTPSRSVRCHKRGRHTACSRAVPVLHVNISPLRCAGASWCWSELPPWCVARRRRQSPRGSGLDA